MKKMMTEMTKTSIFEVFEKMYFISLEPGEFEYPAYAMGAFIDFGGSVRGRLKFLFSRQIATAMVQNMLNLEENEITGQEIEDCLKETANMVCGNLLTKLDANQRFELHMPEFFKIADSDFIEQDNIEKLAFISDDGKLGVILTLFVD